MDSHSSEWSLVPRGPPGHDTPLNRMTGFCSGCKSLITKKNKHTDGHKFDELM